MCNQPNTSNTYLSNLYFEMKMFVLNYELVYANRCNKNMLKMTFIVHSKSD